MHTAHVPTSGHTQTQQQHQQLPHLLARSTLDSPPHTPHMRREAPLLLHSSESLPPAAGPPAERGGLPRRGLAGVRVKRWGLAGVLGAAAVTRAASRYLVTRLRPWARR